MDENNRQCSNVSNNLLFAIVVMLSIVGVIGNIWICIVIHLKMKRNNPNFMLKLISTAYACMMLAFVAISTNSLIQSEVTTHRKVTYLLFTLLRFISEWMLVYVSWTRTLSYIWPMRAAKLWSNITVYGSVGFIVVIGICLRLPTLVLPLHDSERPVHLLISHKHIYQFVFNVFCVGINPLVLLIVSLMIMHVKTQSLNARHQNQQRDARDGDDGIMVQIKGINKLMMAMASTLIICHFPFAILMVLRFILHLMNKDMNDIMGHCSKIILFSCVYVAVCLNASSQIALYVTFSGKFRRGVKDLCCKD